MAYTNPFVAAQRKAQSRTQEAFGAAKYLARENIKMFLPGGSFGAGMEASLGVAKKSAVTGGMQNLAQAGMFNTTIGSGLGTRFEKDVGTPGRLQMHDIRMQRLADARDKAIGVWGSVSNRGPDPSMYANLAARAAEGKASSTGMDRLMASMKESQNFQSSQSQSKMNNMMRMFQTAMSSRSGERSGSYTPKSYVQRMGPSTPGSSYLNLKAGDPTGNVYIG